MNVDKTSAASTDAPLAPPEWTMDMLREGALQTAEVKRAGVVMCRVSLAQAESDQGAARRALADKARRWIQEYLARAGGGGR